MDERSWEVLTQANEDYSGLYELVWAFRTKFMPEVDESELVTAAAAAVRALLDAGYVRLVRFRLEPEPQVSDVPDDQVAAILDSMDSWRPPASWEAPYPSVDATDKGKQVWRRNDGPR
jgi:hypothetical protein